MEPINLNLSRFQVAQRKLPKDGERKMYLDLIAKLTGRKIVQIISLTKDWPDSWIKDSYEEAKGNPVWWWVYRKRTLIK